MRIRGTCLRSVTPGRRLPNAQNAATECPPRLLFGAWASHRVGRGWRDDRGVASRSRWAASPRKGDSEILEVLVYEADGHGSFAHGRRHALDRAASNVAGCEDAGPAGLEQKGSATERPSLVLG